MSTEEDRLDFIAGQVHGLKAALMALIEVNQNPSALHLALLSADQSSQARAEPEPVAESFLEGRLEVFEKLSTFAAKMTELRAKRS